jgi:hypothetical protein
MAKAIEDTKPPEKASESKVKPETPVSTPTDEHQASCFGLEEERGEGWKGSGAAKSEINEAKPSL